MVEKYLNKKAMLVLDDELEFFNTYSIYRMKNFEELIVWLVSKIGVDDENNKNGGYKDV